MIVVIVVVLVAVVVVVFVNVVVVVVFVVVVAVVEHSTSNFVDPSAWKDLNYTSGKQDKQVVGKRVGTCFRDACRCCCC